MPLIIHHFDSKRKQSNYNIKLGSKFKLIMTDLRVKFNVMPLAG